MCLYVHASFDLTNKNGRISKKKNTSLHNSGQFVENNTIYCGGVLFYILCISIVTPPCHVMTYMWYIAKSHTLC